MKTVRDIPHLDGVKVLLRADFNVPIKNDRVTEDFRIRLAIPTIEFLQKAGAKVILMSHLETNEGEAISLRPIVDVLEKNGLKVSFIEDIKKAHEQIEHELSQQDRSVVLLENLRFFPEEKKNDLKFAEQLASLGDIYVNEAFPVSHRAHASVVGITEYIDSYAGLQFEREITNLSKAFNPPQPFLFILGGAKFETKLPLVQKFMTIADELFIGGALANDLFRAKGYEIGRSKTGDSSLDLSGYISQSKITLPIDIVDQDNSILRADQMKIDTSSQDCGPETVNMLKEKIGKAKMILWNGPLGVYEKGFKQSTLELTKIIAEATKNGAVSIIGGGDTVAAINELNLHEGFTFVSSGGGAMLDFLANGTLPGIEALN